MQQNHKALIQGNAESCGGQKLFQVRINSRELDFCDEADGFLGAIYQGNEEFINWRLLQNSLVPQLVSKESRSVSFFFEDTV